MAEEEGNDILSKLFEHDLDEILRTIFFFLDPFSLKQSRCVNWQWNNFIMYRMWNSRAGRQKLKKQLESRWKHLTGVPIMQLAGTGNAVVSMVADEEAVYCGLSNGSVKVFDVNTGKMDRILVSPGVNALVDVNRDVYVSILTYCGENVGNTSVWSKVDGVRLYYDRPHPAGADGRCVKVTQRNIITGASDGSIAIMELGCGVGNSGWGLKYLLIDNKEDIRHIDTDQEWMAVATVRAVKVFRMEENEKPILVTTIPESATKVVLAYPFLLTVDEGMFEGLKVWNVETNEVLRHIRLNGRMFSDMASNGTQVAIMEAIDIDSDEDNFVFVFNLGEVCNASVPVDKLWRRVRIYEKLSSRVAKVALTNTTLLLSHGNNVNIQNFWIGN